MINMFSGLSSSRKRTNRSASEECTREQGMIKPIARRIWKAAALLALPCVCLAYDGYATGLLVSQLDVNTGSASFRIYFSGGGPVCASYTWGYLAVGDINYSTLVATILMAKTTGSTVDVTSNFDAQGFCHIYDVVVH